jgi:hypothetical protein
MVPPISGSVSFLPIMKTAGQHFRWAGIFLLAGMALFFVSGCKSIGPGQVAGDRFDYSDAIGSSWKSQTLLNIVKLRYLDPPIFVDVGQIVASRTFSRTINASASGNIISGGYPAGTSIGSMGLSAGGVYSDQPTVTYTPLTGDRYIRSLMSPVKPESVVFMIQSGWPADAVLIAITAAINGLKNQMTTVNGTTPPTPEFLRALTLIRKIQLSGGVATRLQIDEQKNASSLISLPRSDISPETQADRAELGRLLRLDANASDFNLVYGATAANDREIALQTRSIMQLMTTLAAQVEVPAEDVAEHRVAPGWESITNAPEGARMIYIHCSKDNPPDAFVSVHYRAHWFWIDDRDLRSKRAFSFIMGLFTLADTSDKPPLPQVVVPAH